MVVGHSSSVVGLGSVVVRRPSGVDCWSLSVGRFVWLRLCRLCAVLVVVVTIGDFVGNLYIPPISRLYPTPYLNAGFCRSLYGECKAGGVSFLIYIKKENIFLLTRKLSATNLESPRPEQKKLRWDMGWDMGWDIGGIWVGYTNFQQKRQTTSAGSGPPLPATK